jgi:hypothetical protein
LIADRKTTMPIFSASPAVLAVAVAVLTAYAVYRRIINRRSIERRTHDLGAELRSARRPLMRGEIAKDCSSGSTNWISTHRK